VRSVSTNNTCTAKTAGKEYRARGVMRKKFEQLLSTTRVMFDKILAKATAHEKKLCTTLSREKNFMSQPLSLTLEKEMALPKHRCTVCALTFFVPNPRIIGVINNFRYR